MSWKPLRAPFLTRSSFISPSTKPNGEPFWSLLLSRYYFISRFPFFLYCLWGAEMGWFCLNRALLFSLYWDSLLSFVFRGLEMKLGFGVWIKEEFMVAFLVCNLGNWGDNTIEIFLWFVVLRPLIIKILRETAFLLFHMFGFQGLRDSFFSFSF